MGGATPEERESLKRMHENEEKLRATPNEQESAILETIKDTHKNPPISIITDGEMIIGYIGAVTIRKYIFDDNRE